MDAAYQIEPGQAAFIGFRVSCAEYLGAEKDVFAFIFNRLADDGLRASLAVKSAVYKVAAQIQGAVYDSDSGMLVFLPAKGGTQTELGDLEPVFPNGR